MLRAFLMSLLLNTVPRLRPALDNFLKDPAKFAGPQAIFDDLNREKRDQGRKVPDPNPDTAELIHTILLKCGSCPPLILPWQGANGWSACCSRFMSSQIFQNWSPLVKSNFLLGIADWKSEKLPQELQGDILRLCLELLPFNARLFDSISQIILQCTSIVGRIRCHSPDRTSELNSCLKHSPRLPHV